VDVLCLRFRNVLLSKEPRVIIIGPAGVEGKGTPLIVRLSINKKESRKIGRFEKKVVENQILWCILSDTRKQQVRPERFWQAIAKERLCDKVE
jgi:hypothetical protein